MSDPDDWWPGVHTGILGHGRDLLVADRLKHTRISEWQIATVAHVTMWTLEALLTTHIGIEAFPDPEVRDTVSNFLKVWTPDVAVLEMWDGPEPP